MTRAKQLAEKYYISITLANSLAKWLEGDHPYEPGPFMYALLCNDLIEAFKCADDFNTRFLYHYVKVLYNEFPARTGDPEVDIWGSKAAVDSYIKRMREGHGLTTP